MIKRKRNDDLKNKVCKYINNSLYWNDRNLIKIKNHLCKNNFKIDIMVGKIRGEYVINKYNYKDIIDIALKKGVYII